MIHVFSIVISGRSGHAVQRAFAARAQRLVDFGRSSRFADQRPSHAIHANPAAVAAPEVLDDRGGGAAAAAADRRRHPRLLGRQKRNTLPGKILQPAFGRRRVALVSRKGLHVVEGRGSGKCLLYSK